VLPSPAIIEASRKIPCYLPFVTRRAQKGDAARNKAGHYIRFGAIRSKILVLSAKLIQRGPKATPFIRNNGEKTT